VHFDKIVREIWFNLKQELIMNYKLGMKCAHADDIFAACNFSMKIMLFDDIAGYSFGVHYYLVLTVFFHKLSNLKANGV
jgi:hypothetical protein